MPAATSSPPTRLEVERIAALADPVLRNLLITQCYHELSQQFGTRFGGLTNWCTFATWASKQAGLTIRKEDLQRHLSATIDDVLGTRDVGEQVVAGARVAGSTLSADAVRAALRVALDPAAAAEHASAAVARGNLKVFIEIAPLFATFNADRLLDANADANALARFCNELRPGDPPDGQEWLRRAFTHYYAALFEPDAQARAELGFLATIEIGFHEQTRLQPEIAEGLDIAGLEPPRVYDRLLAMLFPHAGWITRLRMLVTRVLRGPTPLERAVTTLVEETRRQLRRQLTRHVLTIALPGVRLRLGEDLPGPFAPALLTVTNTELLAVLERVDPTRDSRAESGAVDWTDLPDRMHFICDFFRCYYEHRDLFQPPFSATQTAALRAGHLPEGEL